ncbi:kinase-like domain-containing protein [Trichophaea hybrida]|nr:kinase-like domain-containing protein [Trichophaea hybrida]
MECMRDTFKEGVTLGGRYEAINLLNHGSFGMVFLAKDIINDQPVAVKCLVKPGSLAAAESELSVDELSQELAYHNQLGNHPHIVNLLDSFETESHSFLVLEFCPMGDLYEAIRLGRGPLETEHVKTFMLQLVAAVEHMHSRGVYHRDIKPENIFLTQDGDVKLGDFGLATTEEWTEESGVGSDRYMAPEQYDAFGGYSPEQADIWAIGICLLNILFSRNPFSTPTESDPLFADYVLDREALFDIFPTLSYDTFEVLINCLALDPNKRSLAAVREAIERVVSWTTDDESLDDFCTEDRDVIPVSVNREPLRTPSIQTPAINAGSAFPWAQALHMSPVPRQLSAIPDTIDEPTVRYSEEMFKDNPDEYARDMGYFVPHPASYDSGLGASFSSIPKGFNLRSDKIDIKTRALAKDSTFDYGASAVSKSWSDWVIEDEEEEERERFEREKELKRRSWSYESDPGYVDDDDEYDVEWVGGGWEDLAV